ncbi:MAG: carboxymuconolactone decarboxylase family protein [Candidatus Eisenbacteria bacterium]|nr:carboxymuconolactone decarboxylase family protein [Candidatus Eisenbacteria bacterium]
MEKESIRDWKEKRNKLNELVLESCGLPVKRFYGIDDQAYREGALPAKTKELLGLIASFVLRCDDCIRWHAIRCHELGVTDEELNEATAIGLVVGGSITIPHQRRLMRDWKALKEGDDA